MKKGILLFYLNIKNQKIVHRTNKKGQKVYKN